MIWLFLCWCLVAVLLAFGLGRWLCRAEAEWAGASHCARSTPFEPLSRGVSARAGLDAGDEMAEVHRMLARLERHHPRLAKLALLCWVGGLSTRAAATNLGMPVELAEQDLEFARFLLREPGGSAGIG